MCWIATASGYSSEKSCLADRGSLRDFPRYGKLPATRSIPGALPRFLRSQFFSELYPDALVFDSSTHDRNVGGEPLFTGVLGGECHPSQQVRVFCSTLCAEDRFRSIQGGYIERSERGNSRCEFPIDTRREQVLGAREAAERPATIPLSTPEPVLGTAH